MHPKADSPSPNDLGQLFASHSRQWRTFDYVYPVISRRSHGLSIGINLNPGGECNFNCVYCCVDRTIDPKRTDVDHERMRSELDHLLNMVTDGSIWREPEFAKVPADYRRLNDIAFSGDGEPTAYPLFAWSVQQVVALKQKHNLPEVRIILITNATLLDRPNVQQGLVMLDAHQGEIWAKLDAGDEATYQAINQTKVPLDKVVSNIVSCGRERPIVIQTMLLSPLSPEPGDERYVAYRDCLLDMIKQGCRIKLVQLYTIARRTAQRDVHPLDNDRMDRFAAALRHALPDLVIDVFYAAGT